MRSRSPRFPRAAGFGLAALSFALAPPGARAQTLVVTAETGFQPLPCDCPTAPLGGWAQRAAVLDSLRRAEPAALVLDAGGWLAGGIDARVAGLTGEAHAHMGYDALNIGPSELERLRAGDADHALHALPLVCGHPERPRGVPAFRVLERSGRRITIIGAARFAAGAITPAEQVTRALAEAPATDLTVVLCAGGLGPANTITAANPRVDVVLYGGGARTPGATRVGGAVGAAPGTKGRYVGVLDLQERAPAAHAAADPVPAAFTLVPVRAALEGPPVLFALAVRAANRQGGGREIRRSFSYRAE